MRKSAFFYCDFSDKNGRIISFFRDELDFNLVTADDKMEELSSFGNPRKAAEFLFRFVYDKSVEVIIIPERPIVFESKIYSGYHISEKLKTMGVSVPVILLCSSNKRMEPKLTNIDRRGKYNGLVKVVVMTSKLGLNVYRKQLKSKIDGIKPIKPMKCKAMPEYLFQIANRWCR